jgi:hypothetical protein
MAAKAAGGVAFGYDRQNIGSENGINNVIH